MTLVYVTDQFEALHAWFGAPAHVHFLSNPHRHLFKVKLTIVFPESEDSNSRKVEFLTLKLELYNFLKRQFSIYHPITGVGCVMGDSCETMAARIAANFKNAGYQVHSVEVSEDGENGAIVQS